jgi:glycosyltransferase involved in cell wall biosynthesis
MATYNGESYIIDQIVSILAQLGPEDEIVISDDNSTDDTVDILRGFNDRRIKLFRNHFRNPIFNFEYTLRMCKGDLIFLSDQDDLWNPNKLEIVKELLKTYDLVVTDCQIIDENGMVIHESFFDLRHSSKGLVKNFLKNSYLGCCMATNRQIIEKALPFPKRIPMHDIWIGLIGELFGNIHFCNDKLVQYRRHGKNKTFTAEVSQNSLQKKIILRWNLCVCLIARCFNLLLRKSSTFQT